VPSRFDKQFAAFLRRKQAQATYAQFARKLGISASSLHRVQSLEQSATLQRVDHILSRLKCRLRDVFPDDAGPGRREL
jgi:transcriptional regulator with XRE-family HTH domain